MNAITAAKPEIVTFGETLAVVLSASGEPLEHAESLRLTIAGAESNVAIGLARLETRVRWISRLGDDPFGAKIQKTLRGEGVETVVDWDEAAPTAVMFRQRIAGGDASVYYYRKGSAMSRMSAADVSRNWFDGAACFYFSGITPALSESAREATFEAVRLAKELGLWVCFDPNLRLKLWHGAHARQTLSALAELSDVFLPGIDEARFLLNAPQDTAPEDLIQGVADLGPKLVVMKLGPHGSLALRDGQLIKTPPHPVATVVDAIGAGDAFTAGLLSVLVREPENVEEALQLANLLGAMATQGHGDWQSLPTLRQVDLTKSGATIAR
ncbi:MAG: sugar kinase [Capsulimonadaceae bacterium]|nr:sugar kinase [Capsulimonadaceae bacterium]